MAHKNISSLAEKRIGHKVINTQGIEMECVNYINANNITVKFNEPSYLTNSCWSNFIKGKIRNPYMKTIYGVGAIGTKYPTRTNTNQRNKEYSTWCDLLYRVYGCKDNNTTAKRYKSCTVCNDWMLYENFYEWLHEQQNFDKWLNGDRWCLDKDILVKGNKIYEPDKCCLVPNNVNTLFVKRNAARGELLIGVQKNHNKFTPMCSNPITGEYVYLGTYDTQEKAFNVYKRYKEDIIKQVAKLELDSGNITKECYDAMINYEVEITD